jgi:hypothetical protein
MILHLGDKNLPPACTSSFHLISERYYENHYRLRENMFGQQPVEITLAFGIKFHRMINTVARVMPRK